MDVCLITGTSTGIGRAAALHLARNALVNNAGLSSSSPIETYPEAEHRALFEANYFGPVRLTQAVLPGMRKRRHGAIVNVSSILGRIAWANQAAYCASKFAIEAFSEALAQEVAPFAIRVAVVEPGVVGSAIFENTPVHYERESPYKAAMRRNGRFYRTGIPQATPPEEIAAVIHKALTSDRPRLRWAHGWGAGAIARRAAMRDEDFVALGALEDDAYYAKLRDELGIDLA